MLQKAIIDIMDLINKGENSPELEVSKTIDYMIQDKALSTKIQKEEELSSNEIHKLKEIYSNLIKNYSSLDEKYKLLEERLNVLETLKPLKPSAVPEMQKDKFLTDIRAKFLDLDQKLKRLSPIFTKEEKTPYQDLITSIFRGTEAILSKIALLLK